MSDDDLVYVLDPWFVVVHAQDDNRLAVTVRWGHHDQEGGHIRLDHDNAAKLRDAIDAWLPD